MTAQPATAGRLPRATFTSMVAERLRERIADGTLPPGAQLSEVQLADSFGVSRSTIHEALLRLVHEGLLRSEPHRRAFVPVLTEADVRDIYLIREALESAAVRHIIATEKSVEAAEELDRLVGAVGQFDLEFHTALVAASGSERLQRMFSTVISETRLCLGVLTAADARSDLVEEHRRISSMIRDGQIEEALTALKTHFDEAIVTTDSHDRTVEGTR